MLKYVLRRLLQMIPVFLGVTLLLFVLRAQEYCLAILSG